MLKNKAKRIQLVMALALSPMTAVATDGDSYERYLELQAYLDSYALAGDSFYDADEITTEHDVLSEDIIKPGKDYLPDEPMVFFDYSDDEVCTAVLSPVAIREMVQKQVKIEMRKVPAPAAKPNKRISYL